MNFPKVWREPLNDYIPSTLRMEAARLFRIHQLPDNLEKWMVKRGNLKDRIWNSLGVRVDNSIPLDYHETGTVDMDGYKVKKIYFQSRKDFYVTGNLYVPEGKGPFPAVICLHGHWQRGRLAERVQARGHSLAKNGYVCLAVDAFGSGERSSTHGEYENHGGMLGASLMNIGETLMGIQVVDNMRGIDLLCSLDFVDTCRIGATGASGGGNQTMWLAAMDDRVKAAMLVVSVGTFESYVMGGNCICELLPDGLTYTEESGVLALVAPRALKICNCLGDDNPTFSPSEMLRSYAEARKIFQAYESDGNLAYQIFNLPHGFWPEIREAMLGWFDLHLKGVGHGSPKREIPFEYLPEDKAMVFEKGKRDEKVISIARYCHEKGELLKRAFLENKTIDAHGSRKGLMKMLRITTWQKIKKAHMYSPEDGWERIALETECGRMVPILFRKPSSKNNDFLILAAPDSKEKLLGSSIFKEAMDSGKGVLILDLWGTGETCCNDKQELMYRDLPRAILWLGRTFMGEWCMDFSLAAAYVRMTYPEAHMTVGGIKGAGLAALFFSAIEGKSVSAVLEKCPASLVFHRKAPSEYSAMVDYLPGFLSWGDVSLAAALTGADVSFIDPLYSDWEAVDKEGIEKLKSEFDSVRKFCGTSGTISFSNVKQDI
jgi:hypothetical protein